MNRRQALVSVASLVVGRLALGSGRAAAEDSMFMIDGQRLHVETLGSAGPTVVFEAGLGNDISTWAKIAGPIAEFARVFLYDRAGLGSSQPMTRGKSPITADETAKRLHALLNAAGARPPYVMLGHSLGGLYVQMYARTYPADVSGVVLLDSASVDAPSELKTLARLEPGSAEYLEEAGIAESNRQIREAGRFPDVPLAVIAATDHGPFFKKWEPTLMRLQRQMARLSKRGKLIVAQGSGHDIQTDRPDLVIQTVRDMLASQKDGLPKPP